MSEFTVHEQSSQPTHSIDRNCNAGDNRDLARIDFYTSARSGNGSTAQFATGTGAKTRQAAFPASFVAAVTF
jgi:hypothetical protein